jgi:hypothetical protein
MPENQIAIQLARVEVALDGITKRLDELNHRLFNGDNGEITTMKRDIASSSLWIARLGGLGAAAMIIIEIAHFYK